MTQSTGAIRANSGNEPIHVLLVDDEPDFLRGLQRRFEQERWRVTTATDGNQALQLALTRHFDVVVLDLMLPGRDGLDVCRELRRTSQVPVIMLTARSDDLDKILGLEVGADDYLTKPFNFRELQARIKAVLRRQAMAMDQAAATALHHAPVADVETGLVVAGQLRLDRLRQQATLAGKPLALTATEFEILLLLARHPQRVFTREELLDRIWGYDYVGSLRTVDVHIRRLRAKCEADPARPELIKTRWGVGYYLDPRAAGASGETAGAP